LVFVVGFGQATQRVIAVFAVFRRLRGVWVQRPAEFAEQLAQGVALEIGLDMLTIAVLDQMSGEVVGVGLYSAVKAFFFDQAFVAVVGESGVCQGICRLKPKLFKPLISPAPP